MNFFTSAYEVAKKSIKPSLNWKAGLQSVSNTVKNRDPAPIVKEEIEHAEFKERYKHLRFTCFSTYFFTLLAFLTVPFSDSIISLVYSLLAMVLFLMFSYRYAFIAWVSREAWKSKKFSEPVSKTSKDFFTVAIKDPNEFFPSNLN